MDTELGLLAGLLGLFAATAWAGALRTQAHPDGYAFQAYAFAATKYFSGLDALRGISVLAVIWCHVSGTHQLTILNQGNKGVDLFFAISGFLVTTLLLREHRRSGRISLRAFFARRALRIFPLYYAVLALYCILVFATLRGTPKAAEFWDNLPAFLTYTSNWFVTLDGASAHGVTFYFAWSLATEEQFYLFWPALMALLLWLTKKGWVPAVAAVVLVVVQVVAAGQLRPSLLATILGSLAPAILFGAMFAVLLHDRRAFAVLFPVLGHTLAAPLAAGALLLCLQYEAASIVTRFTMALLVACVCIRENTMLHPVLRCRPLVFVGTISYGMYLMHMLAANAARRLLGEQSGLDVFALTTLVVVGMAYLSWRYFESPLLALKGRFQGGDPADAAHARPASAL